MSKQPKNTPSKPRGGRRNPAAGQPATGAREGADAKRRARSGRGAGEVAGAALVPIVAIGASAGGLEAITELLRGLPAQPGLSLIVVSHLHPDYHSALAEILARETEMRVREIDNDLAIEPDTVYVIQPGTLVETQGARFKVIPHHDATDRRLPIDHLLASIASEQTVNAIGVILSGTASDGVLGVREIKNRGGITIAQSPETARYDSMPRNAIASGAIDLVLSPAEIAVELLRLARHPFLRRTSGPVESGLAEPSPDAEYARIFNLLKQRKGNDFTYYKPSTVRRRIRRRMVVHKLNDLRDYVARLQTDGEELEALFRDLLINVTEFFREPDTFEALKQQVFPAILDREARRPIRIWVPGCSTGEEAYSIAVCLLEYLGDLAAGTPIQIFATDIDDLAINKARTGIYPETITQNVSRERLRRFFYRLDSGYQISKQVRDLCVFAVQNITTDPPFSHVDLISCRNLLIYLGSVLQQRAIPMFHYALRPHGFLMLGSAESTGSFNELFEAVDQKQRIFVRRDASAPSRFDFSTPLGKTSRPEPNRTTQIEHSQDTLRREVDRLIMSRYAPPCVLVDKQLNIQLFRGETGPFVEPVPGAASLNLLRMVRQDLVTELNSLLNEAQARQVEVSRSGVKLRDRAGALRIEVVPIRENTQDTQHFLVAFREESVALPRIDGTEASPQQPAVAQDLEAELNATRGYLRSLIEQQESSNEELRSANEEIQSSNEELQSINEELETTKEELQSTNEELATVNDELGARNAKLAQVNDDLNNLISSVGIPIVIVGPDLRIRRFTPLMNQLLNLIPTDVGRPIGDIKSRIEMPNFEDKLEQVLDRLVSTELEGQDTRNDRSYSIRIHPYRTLENKIDGAVVAFIDITDLRRGRDLERAGRAQAEAIVRATRIPQLLLDAELIVLTSNQAYREMLGCEETGVTGISIGNLHQGLWADSGFLSELHRVVRGEIETTVIHVKRSLPGIGDRQIAVNATSLPALDKGHPLRLLLQFSLE